MTDPQDTAGARERRIVEKHRRHVEQSPGVGADVQKYAIGVCDDILADLLRVEAPAAAGQASADPPPVGIAERVRAQPPQRMIEAAIEMATCSPCRSKRGVVIFRENLRMASGYNFKPRGFNCDGTAECKATCRNQAVHAGQFALLRAGNLAQTSDLLHVKVVDGVLVPSEGPSCVQCSKLILASGIAGVWLYHADGWKRYQADEFHRLSLAADLLRGETTDQTRQFKSVEDFWRYMADQIDHLCECNGRGCVCCMGADAFREAIQATRPDPPLKGFPR